jgi:hypothetical protein
MKISMELGLLKARVKISNIENGIQIHRHLMGYHRTDGSQNYQDFAEML